MQAFKFYALLLIIVLLGTNVMAQKTDKVADKKVTLALSVSPNISWLQQSNAGYSSDGSKLGVTYGLLTDFRLFGDNNYSLSTGFTFSHLGGKMKSVTPLTNSSGTNYTGTRNSNFNFTNIDVPLVIRLKTNEIGYNVFYGIFGSEIGFNVNAKERFTIDDGSGTITEEKELDASNEVNLIRSSLVFGLGVQRKISGNAYYRIGLTYHNGLTNYLNINPYAVDGGGNIIYENGSPVVEDRNLSNKLKFIELNLAIVF